MSLISDAVEKTRINYEQFLTDSCIICAKTNTTSKTGVPLADSFTTKLTVKCLALQATTSNSDIPIADINKTKDYKIFNLPINTTILSTDFIKYKDVYYNVVKINSNSNGFSKIVYCEGIIK